MLNYGYQNEYDFVELFNNKYLYELDENSQKFLKELFGDVIGNDEKIISWKNKMAQKTDIFVRYKNYIKNLSLKCGNSNSMHHEYLQEFRRYLGNIGIPYKVIDNYVSYHYGYARDENGRTDLTHALSAEEYKILYQSEIDVFNSHVNKTKIIVDMVDRFVIRGKNSDYDVDALVCGTVDDYVWILKYELYDLVLSKRCLDFTSPHIACMTLGPKKRCLDGNTRDIKDRYILCVRWNFLKEDIIRYKLGTRL